MIWSQWNEALMMNASCAVAFCFIKTNKAVWSNLPCLCRANILAGIVPSKQTNQLTAQSLSQFMLVVMHEKSSRMRVQGLARYVAYEQDLDEAIGLILKSGTYVNANFNAGRFRPGEL